jgi:5,10-methenyltetrahydrofolate synthetase
LEPERGRRCEACFTLRLTAAARKAQELGIRFFTTTLASSRWKSLEQIERAGRRAEQIVNESTQKSTQKEGIARRREGESPLGSAACLKQEPSHLCSFWAQNWRKGGLQQRRNELLKEYGFYNQQYCGCEFSASRIVEGGEWKEVLRQQMREAKKQHREQLARMSETIVEKLACRLSTSPSLNFSTFQFFNFSPSQCIMAYWPLKDEVDIRPLIDQLVVQGKTVLLPKVVDGETMELRRYTSRDDLREGAFRIMEPVGEPFTDYDAIDVALVPGMAFDAAGHRLGRGKGYYDRFLAEHLAPCSSPLAPRLIGVCFPFQRVAEVPSEEHDVCMEEIV